MTRCQSCDECVGYCSCANDEPVRWRLSEMTDYVWDDFSLLTIVEEEMEEHE